MLASSSISTVLATVECWLKKTLFPVGAAKYLNQLLERAQEVVLFDEEYASRVRSGYTLHTSWI